MDHGTTSSTDAAATGTVLTFAEHTEPKPSAVCIVIDQEDVLATWLARSGPSRAFIAPLTLVMDTPFERSKEYASAIRDRVLAALGVEASQVRKTSEILAYSLIVPVVLQQAGEK